jgi:hypothetical protein
MPLESPVSDPNATETQEEGKTLGEGTEAVGGARKRRDGQFTSETAREAAKASARAKREKAQKRAREADLDKLTVKQRVSVAMRDGAPYAEVLAAVQAIIAKAAKGDVPAFRAYLEWVERLGPVEGDAERDAAMALLTPEQRAQVREWLIDERVSPAKPSDA